MSDGKTEYRVVWVSPITGDETAVDGGRFDSYESMTKWVGKLARHRETLDGGGKCKGTVHEVVNGRVGGALLHIGVGGL